MTLFGKACDWKTFFKGLCWFAATFALMKVTQGMFAVVFPLLVIVALVRKKHDLMILLIFVMTSVLIGNTELVTKSTLSQLSIRLSFALVALVMAGRMAAGMTNRYVSPLLGIFPYLVWESFISVGGWSPIVSYLKLMLFVGIYIALYGAACSAASSNPMTGDRQRAIILSGAAFMIIGSVLLIPFPAIGMMKADELMNAAAYGRQITSLFKGITFHSQSLGPVVAVMITLTLCDMLFTVGGWRIFHLMIMAAGFVLTYMTASRTAMGSLIGGMGIASWLFMRGKGVGQRWKGKVLSVMTMVVLLLVCIVLCVPAVQDKVARFVLKFDTSAQISDVTLEQITMTRQGLVDFAMYNFRKKPFTGNGFQVSDDMAYVTRGSLKEYLTAPVEKGVWPTAVLEEGGVVGFVLFAGFLLVAFFTFVSRKAYAAASVLFTMALVNMGEFTFFSMSGAGGMEWTAVFCAAVLDAHRNNAMAWRRPMLSWRD